ncbi:MAG: hypothetical protein ACMV14_08680, partial [Prevotella sp.]
VATHKQSPTVKVFLLMIMFTFNIFTPSKVIINVLKHKEINISFKFNTARMIAILLLFAHYL